MSATTGLLTFAEFERMPEPDEPVKEELLDGELIQMPPPVLDHMETAQWLFLMLVQMLERPNHSAHLGGAYIETGYKMGSKTWLVPDVSITHANQGRGDYWEGAPALAVEIVSESNRADDMDRKVKKYLSNGGIEVWVVYPKTQCVWVFRQGRAEEFCGVLRSEIIPELIIQLDQLFRVV
jgi:Uma2 family endonuclease